jgi:hypothetical protein
MNTINDLQSDDKYEELFPSQAAKRLHIDVSEIKRRLKSGELQGRRDEKGRWRITVRAKPARPSEASNSGNSSSSYSAVPPDGTTSRG